MEKELEALLGKVEKAVLLVERMQAEKATLEKHLLAAETERDRLRQNMSAARVRVESLIGQIPEEA